MVPGTLCVFCLAFFFLLSYLGNMGLSHESKLKMRLPSVTYQSQWEERERGTHMHTSNPTCSPTAPCFPAELCPSEQTPPKIIAVAWYLEYYSLNCWWRGTVFLKGYQDKPKRNICGAVGPESEPAKEGSHEAVSRAPWVSSQARGCPNHSLG